MSGVMVTFFINVMQFGKQHQFDLVEVKQYCNLFVGQIEFLSKQDGFRK